MTDNMGNTELRGLHYFLALPCLLFRLVSDLKNTVYAVLLSQLHRYLLNLLSLGSFLHGYLVRQTGKAIVRNMQSVLSLDYECVLHC